MPRLLTWYHYPLHIVPHTPRLYITVLHMYMYACRVQEASAQPPLSSGSGWESESSDEEEEEEPETEEVKVHKKQFSDWRKKHYNEFHAAKRAKELMRKVNFEAYKVMLNVLMIAGRGRLDGSREANHGG